MQVLHQFAIWTGLAAALAGGLYVVRGAWDEAAGCLALVIVCSVLAAVWEPTE